MIACAPSPGIELLNQQGADVTYDPAFLDAGEADRAFEDLLRQVRFNAPEDSRVRLFGEWHEIPRRQVGYGDEGTCYRFAGCAVRARPWAETPALMALREALRSRTGFDANFVLVNLYRSGADSIGWHQDDEADLGPQPTILSLSLGATRDFQFRHRQAADNGLPTVTIPLAHGSLLTMRDPTNRSWKHQLPRRGGKQPESIGPRLNGTFRRIV